MKKISFCLPSKDNLRYLKSSITSILKNSELDNEIIVWVDSDNDGTVDWLKANNIKYLVNPLDKPQGIAAGYNRCIEAATNKIVCMFHADMFMGKGFDINLIKHLKPKTVIAGTRIEPPLHPPGKEKIVEDFGMYPEDFNEEDFNQFVSQIQKDQKNQVTYGIFAPWACYKNEIIEMGMHDESFHSYHEDSDIFNRFVLNGMKLIQSRDALVYHLTCRGGIFQDGMEKVTDDINFHNMRDQSRKHYLKKWGSWIKNDEYHYPILSPVYKKKLHISNPNTSLHQLQDWFNEGNDVIVEIDGNNFTQQDFQLIQQLNDIIKDSGEVGSFELGNLKITISELKEYQNELIKNKSYEKV
jgi:glycosyltransferase involved in cell wall biosynthesis